MDATEKAANTLAGHITAILQDDNTMPGLRQRIEASRAKVLFARLRRSSFSRASYLSQLSQPLFGTLSAFAQMHPAPGINPTLSDLSSDEEVPCDGND